MKIIDESARGRKDRMPNVLMTEGQKIGPEDDEGMMS